MASPLRFLALALCCSRLDSTAMPLPRPRNFTRKSVWGRSLMGRQYGDCAAGLQMTCHSTETVWRFGAADA